MNIKRATVHTTRVPTVHVLEKETGRFFLCVLYVCCIPHPWSCSRSRASICIVFVCTAETDEVPVAHTWSNWETNMCFYYFLTFYTFVPLL